MYYEINISLNGVHLFATHERSIRTEKRLKEVYKIFKEKFPANEGYSILISEIETIGHIINNEDMEV